MWKGMGAPHRKKDANYLGTKSTIKGIINNKIHARLTFRSARNRVVDNVAWKYVCLNRC